MIRFCRLTINVLCVFSLWFSANCFGEDYYWYSSYRAGAASPEDACVAMAEALTYPPFNNYYRFTGYFSSRSDIAATCKLEFYLGGIWHQDVTHGRVYRGGSGCASPQIYDEGVGSCITPKPATNRASGFDNCNVATDNPVNIATGSKFFKEIDYTFSANPLFQVLRTYDSVDGAWAFNFLSRLTINGDFAEVSLAEGSVIQFRNFSGNWVHPQTEYFILKQIGSSFIFATADNETSTFDANGQLIKLTKLGKPDVNLLHSNHTVQIQSLGRVLTITLDSSSNLPTAIATPDGIIEYIYDSAGRLKKVLFNTVVTTEYLYENSSFPTAITAVLDANGRRYKEISYLPNGKVASSSLADNNEKIVFDYIDENSTQITSSLGRKTIYRFKNFYGKKLVHRMEGQASMGCPAANKIYHYASAGFKRLQFDWNNNQTSFTRQDPYQRYDLETSRTEAYGTPQARTITTQWHATYRLPTLITEPGKTTSFGYDASGNLLSKTETDTALNKSRTWTYTYNALGQVLTANGPRIDVNDVTTYTYYSSASNTAGSVHSVGDLATVTDAVGNVTSITNYDLNGRPLSITDANGVVTTFTYWPRGWLKTKTVNGVQTTQYDYDGVGQLTKATLPDGSYLSYTYDTAHRLTDIADNSGNKIHYILDAMGNRLKEETKDPGNSILKTRSRVFDSLNRLQKDIGGTSPSTQITQYTYDNNGNLKTVTDPLNHITTNGYDALNRLITVTDPANGVASTTYNNLDQITQVKDPRLVTTNYTINALGDVTLTQSPDRGNTNQVYDLAGNVIQKTDARGVVSNYTYDALNRVTSISYPANTAENVSFTYDSTANSNKGKGRLTGYSNDGGATVLTYDGYGNITLQTEIIGSQIYTTAYQYDSANRINQITYPSGRIVIYGRNALGNINLVQMRDTAASPLVTLISSATYEPFGPVKNLTFGNGVTTTFAHDADYRISRITTSSTPNWDYVYSYDPAGNITGITDQVSTFSKTYGYDLLDRIISDINNTGAWSYQYDPVGNRTKRINSSTQTLTYATNSNRMTKVGSTNQVLDSAGNLLTNATAIYTYNNANRLSSYSTGSTLKAQYSYNALGQRTARTVKPQHLHYDLNGRYLDETLFNSNGTFASRTEYIYLDDMPIARATIKYGTNNVISSRKTTFIHTDHLNTPRLMTDATKKTIWRWDGDAFGQTGPNQNPDGDATTETLNLRFPGQMLDTESGLYYNINRDYQPVWGRYLQSDPIGLNGGLNTFGYVEGNPISNIDPLGLWAIPLIPAGVEAASALVTGAIGVIGGEAMYNKAREGMENAANPRTVPYPERKRGRYACVCRADKNGRSPDNCSNEGQDFAMGYGEGATLSEAKKAAEKDAKDKLGAKSVHHVQCRCTAPNGNRIIPHG
jgi:RHS repeat-associated protein